MASGYGLVRALRRRLQRSSLTFAMNQKRLRISARHGAVGAGPVRAFPRVSEPLIALTYDDGPSEVNTPRLLEILREHSAHATFFVVGSEVQSNRDLLAQIAAEGHEVANHSFSHANPLDLDDWGLATEIDDAHDVISQVVADARLFRSPFGKRPKQSARLCAARQMTTVLWSIDSGDTRDFAVDRIVAEVVGRARPGDIVLMHDGGAHRPRTIEATRLIVNTLGARGYRFVTVSQLLANARPEDQSAESNGR